MTSRSSKRGSCHNPNKIITPHPFTDPTRIGYLGEEELWWVNRYAWLTERGYQLRPRFRPERTPSWIVNGKVNFHGQYVNEDAMYYSGVCLPTYEVLIPSDARV